MSSIGYPICHPILVRMGGQGSGCALILLAFAEQKHNKNIYDDIYDNVYDDNVYYNIYDNDDDDVYGAIPYI